MTGSNAMVLLVTGGREFSDKEFIYSILDRVQAKRGVSLLIHGAARGADKLAAAWATDRGIPTKAFPANWKEHGKKAGFMRNEVMLDEGVDGVVAFPGGNGTAHMVALAEARQVKVWKVRPS